jgi:hypothetical protein
MVKLSLEETGQLEGKTRRWTETQCAIKKQTPLAEVATNSESELNQEPAPCREISC